jgi:hypothetical protein
VYISPQVKRRFWISLAVAPFLVPGWRGELVPVSSHDDIIRKASGYDAGEVFGVSRKGDTPGEEWHSQFMGSSTAQFLDLVALRGIAPSIVPPTCVAHIPPGADLRPERADGYYWVEVHLRWPWWWPGGGVDWRQPDR